MLQKIPMIRQPHWPAVINSIDITNKLQKYNVTIYGTGEVTWVRAIYVFLFCENKSGFGASKLKNIKANL